MTMTETLKFESLPANLEELKALPEAALDTPFKAAALTVAALCRYPAGKDDAIEMLNFLKGPQPLSNYEKQFLRDRFMDKDYVPRSYFNGAVPANNYEPDVPYTVEVFDNPYSYQDEGYATLWIRSGGADSPRQVRLRRKGEQWFLWEQFLLPDIRKPAAEDPWA
ncbi:MAG: hypothetical protein IJK33_04255 [Clostridia bacterium]|nr:hypothetical protein [Clostridia bacterium]MBQ6183081.1 hypothetical protein [Clostridia bacterium]